MMAKRKTKTKDWPAYYDQTDILNELLEEPVHFSLDDRLQKEIFSGKRTRKLNSLRKNSFFTGCSKRSRYKAPEILRNEAYKEVRRNDEE